jgi:hypothetical protein
MPTLLAKENSEQLPRMMVGTRIAVFECSTDEVQERDNAYFTPSVHQPNVEIELEYMTMPDLLLAVKQSVDEQVVRVLLGKRVLPFITIDVYAYNYRYGLHVSAMTLGEASAVCVASCFESDDDDGAEDDDDDEAQPG